MPGKSVPVNPMVKHESEKKNINLEALYDGGNPFETSETGPAASVEVEKEDFPNNHPDRGERRHRPGRGWLIDSQFGKRRLRSRADGGAGG